MLMLHDDAMIFPQQKPLPTVAFTHLHLVVRDELHAGLAVATMPRARQALSIIRGRRSMYMLPAREKVE